MLGFRSGSEESALASAIPHMVTATTDTRDTGTAITRAAITAITAVIHITERITILAGRTTTEAIELTSTISIITTATKAQVGVRLRGWLGAIPSQPFFA